MSETLKNVMACLFLLIGVNAFADESPTKGDSTPQTTLMLAMQSLEQGDADTYINCLSSDEIRFQVGYAMYLYAFLEFVQSHDLNNLEPEARLITMNLRDLIKKQYRFKDQINQKGQYGMSIPLNGFKQHIHIFRKNSNVPWTLDEQTDDNQLFRPYCIMLSSKLENPLALLADVIQILDEHTLISNQGKHLKPDVEYYKSWKQAIQSFKDADWTFYQRGNYAVACSSSLKKSRASTTNTAGDSSDNSPSILTVGSQENISVDFIKQDGEWKINRLLPFKIFDLSNYKN